MNNRGGGGVKVGEHNSVIIGCNHIIKVDLASTSGPLTSIDMNLVF